jgi:hypothetical protein
MTKNNLALLMLFFINRAMRFIFALLVIYVALIFYGGFAIAMQPSVPQSIVPLKAKPIDEIQNDAKSEDAKTESNNPFAVSQGEWRIENVKRDNGFPTDTCVMETTYDNGLVISFKGKSGRLTALRVRHTDTQKAHAIKGFIGLGFDKTSFGLQSRSINGQIDASLITVSNVHERLLTEGFYRLRIGMEDYYFSTSGFEKGYRDLLTCQGKSYDSLKTLKLVQEPSFKPNRPSDQDMPSTPIGPVKSLPIMDTTGEVELVQSSEEGKDVPLALALPMIVPSDYTFTLDDGVDPVQTVSWTKQGFWPETLKSAIKPLGHKVFVKDTHIRIAPHDEKRDTGLQVVQEEGQLYEKTAKTTESSERDSFTWTAREGEKIADVLALWAQIANVNTQIDLENDPVLTKNYRFEGDFQGAVEGLMVSTIGIQAELRDGDEAMMLSKPQEKRDTKNNPINMAQPPKISEPQKWRALQGTNLKTVLNRWSVKEGIEFVWQMDEAIMIPQSMKVETSFEQAVTNLLDQYKGRDSIRPIAQLNQDPDTGRKTLIIQKAKS